MRVLLHSAAVTLTLLVASPVLACGGSRSAPPPAPESGQEYKPEAQPPAGDVLALTRGQSIDDILKIAGAGLGGAVVAGSIAWSIAKRPTA